jgi:hypothetical protein
MMFCSPWRSWVGNKTIEEAYAQCTDAAPVHAFINGYVLPHLPKSTQSRYVAIRQKYDSARYRAKEAARDNAFFDHQGRLAAITKEYLQQVRSLVHPSHLRAALSRSANEDEDSEAARRRYESSKDHERKPFNPRF